MPKPKNLDEYYAKKAVLRDKLKTALNGLSEEVDDLAGVSKSDLMAAGLSDTYSAMEDGILKKAAAVVAALKAFDNACS